MDSADSIPESAWSALDYLSEVPIWAWLFGAVVGFVGTIVLVFPFSDISFRAKKHLYLHR